MSVTTDDITPALAPPDGEQSNFTDPPTIAGAIVAGLSVCLIFSTLSAVLRVFAQWYLFKKFVWADLWVAISVVAQIAFAGLLYACIPYGGGRHMWDVSLTNYYSIKELLFVDYVVYDIAIAAAKVAILLQLKAIFAGNGQRNRFFWSIVVLIFINLAFYLALSFALIFQCQPVAKGWDAAIPGVCLDQQTLLASSGPFNILSDFLIFLLPIWAIWQLHLPIRKRVEVCCAFAVGLFGCICSAVRLVYSERLALTGDETVIIFENQLWANAEICAGILIANAMILPRFFRTISGKGSVSFSYPTNPTAQSRTARDRRSKGMSAWPGPSSRSMREPWIELKDGGAPTTVASKSVDGSSKRSNSDDLPTYGGIVKTIEIETRTEVASPSTRVAYGSPHTVVQPGQRF